MKPIVYLDAEAASKYLHKIGIQITPGGLANLRWLKKGPKYTKVAGKVRYRQAWLDEYIAAGTVSPRSQRRRVV